MTKLDQKITRFVLAISAAMLVTGGLAVILLAGLAALVPLPEDSLARDLRNGAAMALAIVIGLRVSRWLDGRWGGE